MSAILLGQVGCQSIGKLDLKVVKSLSALAYQCWPNRQTYGGPTLAPNTGPTATSWIKGGLKSGTRHWSDGKMTLAQRRLFCWVPTSAQHDFAKWQGGLEVDLKFAESLVPNVDPTDNTMLSQCWHPTERLRLVQRDHVGPTSFCYLDIYMD